MKDKRFQWVSFYTEFATKLLVYKNERALLIQKIKKVYEDIHLKFPKLESDNHPIDIDPFTVYGLFNKGISNGNRIAILGGMKDEFGIQADIPDSFEGIPVLNNLRATFYFFKEDRGKQDIDNLWRVFETALALAHKNSAQNRKMFSEAYDTVLGQMGIRWNITMGLYWICPDTFINLDSRNRWYISDTRNMPTAFVDAVVPLLETVPVAADYLRICDACKNALINGDYEYKNFAELSYYAWVVSERVNEENRVKSRMNDTDALSDSNIDTVRYWIYAPGDGACKWEEFYKAGIIAIGWGEIGDLKNFDSKEEMKVRMKEILGSEYSYKNVAHATWQFANEMKPGDIVFAKKGMHTILGRGVVVSAYEYDENMADGYNNIRRIQWTHKGEWPHPGQAVMKTLTDITAYTEYVEKLKALFETSDTEDDKEEEIIYPPYSADDFLKEVFMDKSDYDMMAAVLKNKKNIILQGAPGVGKTYAAKRLAYSIMGVKDKERVMMVQFHQSYSYEDFVMGFRPSTNGFELRKGAFYNFCKKAEIDSDNDYFFIIDEINRGNLSKIFGELFMLIENDKRGIELQLLYSDEKFSVPKNVYLIGMMNTADRSLAMLDYALRRRFAFIEMKPGFETEGFRTYRMELDSLRFDRLIDRVEKLNQIIAEDETLGEGFMIGHSYFCNLTPETVEKALSGIVEYELCPLLKEYWFDELTKVKDWTENLRGAIR